MDTEKVVTDTAEQAADQAAEQQAAETAVEAQPAAEEKPAAQAAQQPDEAEPTAEGQAEQPAKEEKEEEKGTAQPDPAAKLADAELRAAAALAGIPAARIPYAVRMADAGKVTDAASAAQQIAAIVRDVPELKQQAQGTGSGGNFARRTLTAEEKARQDFAGQL